MEIKIKVSLDGESAEVLVPGGDHSAAFACALKEAKKELKEKTFKPTGTHYFASLAPGDLCISLINLANLVGSQLFQQPEHIGYISPGFYEEIKSPIDGSWKLRPLKLYSEIIAPVEITSELKKQIIIADLESRESDLPIKVRILPQDLKFYEADKELFQENEITSHFEVVITRIELGDYNPKVAPFMACADHDDFENAWLHRDTKIEVIE